LVQDDTGNDGSRDENRSTSTETCSRSDSYGFMDQSFGPLMAFIASQLIIMGLGLISLP